MTTERERALEYRRKMQARANDRLARERSLAGNEAAANAVKENTAALRKWDGWQEEEKVQGDAK